jgi:hypothetical protein
MIFRILAVLFYQFVGLFTKSFHFGTGVEILVLEEGFDELIAADEAVGNEDEVGFLEVEIFWDLRYQLHGLFYL